MHRAWFVWFALLAAVAAPLAAVDASPAGPAPLAPVDASPAGPAPSATLFFDDFEAYAEGSILHGQGGWLHAGQTTERMTLVAPGYRSQKGAAGVGRAGAPNDFKTYHTFGGTAMEILTGRVKWDGPVLPSSTLFNLGVQPHSGDAYIFVRGGNFTFGTDVNTADSGVRVVSGSWYLVRIETRPASITFKILDPEGTQLLSLKTLPPVTPYPYNYVVLFPAAIGPAYNVTYDDIRVEELLPSGTLFYEDFEAYAAGSTLNGQGGWVHASLTPETLTVVSPGYQSQRAATSVAEADVNDFNVYHTFAGKATEKLTLRFKWDGPVNLVSNAIFDLGVWPYGLAAGMTVDRGYFTFRTDSNTVNSSLRVTSGSWYFVTVETRPSSVTFRIFDPGGTQLLSSKTLPPVTPYPYNNLTLKPRVDFVTYNVTYDDIWVGDLLPEIEIRFPLRNAVLSTAGTRLQVDARDFNLTEDVGPCAPRHGRFRVYVNDAPAFETTNKDTSIPELPTNLYRLGAQLVCTDGSSLSPPVWSNVLASARDPVLRILRPMTPMTVSTLGARIAYSVDNFNLNPGWVGGPKVPGEGHVHVLVNGTYVAESGYTSVDVGAFPLGPFTFALELHNNDHSLVTTFGRPFGFNLTVSAVGQKPGIALTAPATIKEGDILAVSWVVRGFVLDAETFGGSPEPGRGHVHVFVDGTYRTALAGTSMGITGLAAGSHTIQVRLFNNDHSELATPVSDAVSVAVTAATPPANVVDASVFYVSLTILFVVIAILAVLLLERRTREPPRSR